MQAGSTIGEWIVEERLAGEDRYRCHRRDSPFRKAVLQAVRGADPGSVEQEASALARLQHPNIGAVFGLTTSGDDLFLVSEAVQGTDLRSFVGPGEGVVTLPLRTALEVGVQLCEALAAAHDRRVAHGDFRPERVLLGPDGRARVIGFEPSRSTGDFGSAATYLAPELRAGERPTPSGDLYALGIVLYELVLGVTVAHVPRTQRSALSLDRSFPRGLHDLITRLTHPDPRLRPPARQAGEALSEVLRTTLGEPASLDSGWTVDPPATDPTVAMLPARIGRYEVVREIGRGGVGVVYEALDPDLRRKVALKVLLAGTFARSRDIQRFKKEAQAVARLDHPGIVKVLDIGSHLEGTWFAMEFVDGPTLLERLDAMPDRRLPWREAARIAAGVGRALGHAHRAGVLHRDVKPNNVLLEGGGEPRLADFGLALDAESHHTRLTGTGQLLGTPMYMAPEQAAGELERLGPTTDVYGLGVLLYEALTGTVPYEGATALQVVGRILAGHARSPRDRVPELPRSVDTVCMKALRLDPRDRYPDAESFAEDLDRCLREQPILAAEPRLGERTRWFVRRNSLPLAAGAAVVLAVGIALGGASALAGYGARRSVAEHEAVAARAWEGARARMAEARAVGRPDQEEAAFRTFVDHPEHVGTQALVDAFRDAARRAGEDGDGEGRLSALSAAYGAASRSGEHDAVLVDLARAALEERRFDLVLAAATTLRRHGAPVPESELAGLEQEALFAHRDLAGAGDRGATRIGGLARIFAGATRTELHGWKLEDWPGGGFVFQDTLTRRHVLLEESPGLPVRAALRLPVATHGSLNPFSVDGTTFLLVSTAPGTSDEGGAAVLRVDGDRVEVDHALAQGEITAVASADLDDDGTASVYYGSGRELFELERRNGVWTQRVPHPETQASNSQIRDLAITDSDADGRPELAVGAAEWGAYDVRWLTPCVGEACDGPLEVAARDKLGVVSGFAVSNRPAGPASLVACKEDAHPSRRVFPPDQPSGVGAGLWELTRVPGPGGSSVERRRFDALPCGPLHVGDFDGDGLDDVAVDVEGDLALYLRRTDGDFDRTWMVDTTPIGVAQLDADPASELVVTDRTDDGRVWVLGAGDERLPVLLPAHAPRAEPPPGTDGSFARAWDRAEDLVFVGRTEDAADAHRALATLRWGRPEATASLLRAADLRFSAGDPLGAADLYRETDRAAGAGAGGSDALAAAARSLAAAHDDRAELAVLQELGDRGALDEQGRARASELSALAHLPELRLSFDQPLDRRWEIPDPMAVHRDRARQTLEVEASGERVLARLPVTWDGRWFGLELDAEVQRTEWSSGLRVGLVPRGTLGPVLGLTFLGRGGGELLHRTVSCQGLGAEHGAHHDPAPGPIHGALFTTRGSTRCTYRDASSPPAPAGREVGELADRKDDGEAFPEGPYDLVIASVGQESAFTVLALHTLTVHGLRVDETAPLGPHDAWSLVDGDPAPVGTTASPALRAAAALERADLVGLSRALADLDEPDRSRLVDHVVHARLASQGPMLRSWLGDDWWAAFARAWATTLATHGADDDTLADALLSHLDGLEAAEPRDDDDRSAIVVLLARRGASAGARAVDDVARASLERAVALADRGGGSEDLGWIVPVALVDLAEVELRSGSADRAVDRIVEAVRRSSAPIVTADTIRARPTLAPLLDDPRWLAAAPR